VQAEVRSFPVAPAHAKRSGQQKGRGGPRRTASTASQPAAAAAAPPAPARRCSRLAFTTHSLTRSALHPLAFLLLPSRSRTLLRTHRTDGRRAGSPAAPPPARGSWRRMPLSPSRAAGGLPRRCPRAAVLPAAAATARLEAMQIGGRPPCAPDDPPRVFQLLEDRVRKSSGFSGLILQLQRRLCAVSSCDAVWRFASFCVCVCPPAWGFRATVAWHRQLVVSSPLLLLVS
jgi:hypothetical protein